MKILILLIGLFLVGIVIVVLFVLKYDGIESKNYKWNVDEGEKFEVLKFKGDKKCGEEVYEICGVCYLFFGVGCLDGIFL